MKLYRKAIFWFGLLSFAICLVNFIGMDDKNLLLFFTNPLSIWLESVINLSDDSKPSALFQLYAAHLCFWLLAGLMVDVIIAKVKSCRR